jgi:hypothetical protein
MDDPLMHSQLVHEDDPFFPDPLNDMDFMPPLASPIGTKVSAEEIEQEKPKKKAVRKKGLHIDSVTSLSENDIRAMQAGKGPTMVKKRDHRKEAEGILESLNHPIIGALYLQ